MTSKLQIYNAALRHCGDTSLSSTSEDRKPRYLLDEVWDDGGINFCLEQGFWIFAERHVRIDYDTDVTPEFGYNRAFSKPSDWVKTCGLCSDEFFTTPILNYDDRAGYIYASVDEIYLVYVSDGASYGTNTSAWSQSFADYVAAHFAALICKKLTGDENKQAQIELAEKKLLTIAQNHNASARPPKFPPPGRWALSRFGGGRSDRGPTGNLIG